MVETVPQYRLPGGQLAAADGVALVAPDFLFWSASNPLPVVTEVFVPGIYDAVPFYLDPRNIKVVADGVCLILADGSVVGHGNPLPTTGGGGGPVAAVDVTLAGHSPLDNVQEALDFLLYVPIDASAVSGGSSNEIGASVATVNFVWTVNRDGTLQTLNQGVGSVPVTDRAHLFTGPYTTNQTFSVTVDDGVLSSDSASVSVTFQPKRYWDPFPTQSPAESDVLAMQQELSSSRGKAIVYDCTGGRYPFYAYPVSFGALTAVTVGGLAFSAYSISVVNLTNAQGYAQDYYYVVFDIIQTGSNISVVFS